MGFHSNGRGMKQILGLLAMCLLGIQVTLVHSWTEYNFLVSTWMLSFTVNGGLIGAAELEESHNRFKKCLWDTSIGPKPSWLVWHPTTCAWPFIQMYCWCSPLHKDVLRCWCLDTFVQYTWSETVTQPLLSMGPYLESEWKSESSPLLSSGLLRIWKVSCLMNLFYGHGVQDTGSGWQSGYAWFDDAVLVWRWSGTGVAGCIGETETAVVSNQGHSEWLHWCVAIYTGVDPNLVTVGGHTLCCTVKSL